MKRWEHWESESVSRGMESSIAVILAALIGKSQDTGELAKILTSPGCIWGCHVVPVPQALATQFAFGLEW